MFWAFTTVSGWSHFHVSHKLSVALENICLWHHLYLLDQLAEVYVHAKRVSYLAFLQFYYSARQKIYTYISEIWKLWIDLMGSHSKNIENVWPAYVRQTLKLFTKKTTMELKAECCMSLKQEQDYPIWRVAGSIPLKCKYWAKSCSTY